MAQVVLTVALIGVAGWKLRSQWTDASRADFHWQLHIGWLAAASALVFGTYIVLIETWRRVLAGLGAQVAFAPAARIWFAANLGKYVPGKIWTVSAMMVMMTEQGVPLAVSGASAVVMAVAPVATGFAVTLLTSLPTVQRLIGGSTAVVLSTIGMVLSLVAAPLLTRQWNRIAAKLGRPALTVQVPLKAILPALVGSAASWFLYGLAFQWLIRSLLGSATGSVADYTAAYCASYLFGYLALFAPGGIGMREIALSTILPPLGLATAAQAAVIAVASRLWLTVVELIPSVIAAARSISRKASSSKTELTGSASR
ncbi:MAG TPA: lysylphosphatidylglycerol synthase domain-containing protein [Gemmatimonadaceae bacterium]